MESFAELLEQSEVEKKMRPGAILTGTVIEIGPEFVTVHAGLKSESTIPVEQFRDDTGSVEVHVGDTVEVALDTVEDGFGATRLSREKAKRAKAWKRLEEAFEEADAITGIINGKVKGGFTVDIDDIRAFLPGSLVDVRPVRDTSYLEGKPLEFKVIKLDRRRNNVVVSRRAVVEEENSAERDALLESLDKFEQMGLVVDMAALMVMIARVRAEKGQVEQAVEVLAGVLADPSRDQLSLFEQVPIGEAAAGVLEPLERELDPDIYAAAHARGGTISLDVMVKQLLSGT